MAVPAIAAVWILSFPSAAAQEVPWKEILGPSEAVVPAAGGEVRWRTDLDAALGEARETNRPLFVTLRCLPCKQCAGFDQEVLEGGPELDPWLARFVTVRLTSMRAIDRRLLPFDGFQDLDLSWWGYFLAPEGSLYGVYGGRDEVSDTTRMSVPSLANTMRRVLDHHYDPRRKRWALESPPVRVGEAETPDRLPGWDAWVERGFKESDPQECLHCHQVADILRAPKMRAGTFDKTRDFEVWPFPENLGIVLERDHGLRVASVTPDSPAGAAGIQPGDVLGAAEGRKLFSEADLRGILHRLPRSREEVALIWRRASKEGQAIGTGTLKLEPGWRRTVLGWRKSVAEADLGAHMGFGWALAVSAADRRARGIPAEGLAVRPWFGKQRRTSRAARAGLRGDDIIVAIDGQRPEVAERSFLVWFRLNYEAGDEVELTVVDRAGTERKVGYVLAR